MSKTFYTERDIQDMVASGVTTLRVDDSVALTMLARETALKLGLQLIYDSPDGEASPYRAPVRFPKDEPLDERVKAAVMARLGPDADEALVGTIVTRVLAELK